MVVSLIVAFATQKDSIESSSPCKYCEGGSAVVVASSTTSFFFGDGKLKSVSCSNVSSADDSPRDVTPPPAIDQWLRIDRFSAISLKKRYRCRAMTLLSAIEKGTFPGMTFLISWQRYGINPATKDLAHRLSSGCTHNEHGARTDGLSAQ